MITTKETERKEIADGLSKMEEELIKTETRLDEIKKITSDIQTNSIEIASLNTSIQELKSRLEKEFDYRVENLSNLKFLLT